MFKRGVKERDSGILWERAAGIWSRWWQRSPQILHIFWQQIGQILMDWMWPVAEIKELSLTSRFVWDPNNWENKCNICWIAADFFFACTRIYMQYWMLSLKWLFLAEYLLGTVMLLSSEPLKIFFRNFIQRIRPAGYIQFHISFHFNQTVTWVYIFTLFLILLKTWLPIYWVWDSTSI